MKITYYMNVFGNTKVKFLGEILDTTNDKCKVVLTHVMEYENKIVSNHIFPTGNFKELDKPIFRTVHKKSCSEYNRQD